MRRMKVKVASSLIKLIKAEKMGANFLQWLNVAQDRDENMHQR